MKTSFNQKGQGILEALVSLPLLLISGFIICSLLYRLLLFSYVDYQLHEALICTEAESTLFCESELRSHLRKVSLTSHTLKISLYQGVRYTTGKVEINLNPPLNLEKKYRKSAL